MNICVFDIYIYIYIQTYKSQYSALSCMGYIILEGIPIGRAPFWDIPSHDGHRPAIKGSPSFTRMGVLVFRGAGCSMGHGSFLWAWDCTT